MTKFSVICIIYNPNSTGPSEDLARKLADDIRTTGAEINLLPTEHAGHATELAFDIATRHDNPLIISSSGDGGYNEVINGALRAQENGAHPVCAVLPAGNANDHSHALSDRPLAEAVRKGKVTNI